MKTTLPRGSNCQFFEAADPDTPIAAISTGGRDGLTNFAIFPDRQAQQCRAAIPHRDDFVAGTAAGWWC